MTEILLIRHGETDWNAERRLQGHLDIELNAEGRRQADALGFALQDEQLDAIYASDLQRARQTAQAIAVTREASVQIEPTLRERCYGAFEGLCYAEIEQRFPQDYLAWQAREVDARYPSGVHIAETLREFSARALGAISHLAQAAAGRKIAIVSHGGVLDCVYRAAHYLGFDSERDFKVLNASVNRIVWDDGAIRIVKWADVTHLSHDVLDEIDK